jgi:hypothetical protein
MFGYDDTPAPPPLQPPPWADLDANLVACIVGLCTLKDYASCRVVCASWHAALPPLLSQPIAVLPADDGGHHPVSLAVCLLHTRRWHRIPGLRQPTRLDAAHCRCVGARDGWLALVAGVETSSRRAVLFNPFTGGEIPLDAALYEPEHDLAPKIVFSPNPTRHGFVAVSLCRPDRLVLQKAYGGGSLTLIEDTEALMDKAVLVDLAYGEDDNVYCLTTEGHVYRLRFHRRLRGRKSPLHVQPLLSDHAEAAVDAFPPPYDAIARLAEAKNLALCNGALYQVWRRPAGAGNATIIDAPPVPGAGSRRHRASVYEGEVFVLRHDPTNRPHCWSFVEGKDLGGVALFVGMNDAVAVRGRGVCRNSVHFWDIAADDRGYDPVVYSVARGLSVRWPAATGGLSSPVWYIMPVIGRPPAPERGLNCG